MSSADTQAPFISRDDTRLPVVAICLGKFNGRDHYYLSNGQWRTSDKLNSRFVYRTFITDTAELQPVIDALPSTSPDAEVLLQLQKARASPPREAGANLIRRMRNFQLEALQIRQMYAEKLGNPAETLCSDEKIMKLGDIAAKLLPDGAIKTNTRGLKPAALYAVHCALVENELAFRNIGVPGFLLESNLYVVRSKADYENAKFVQGLLRGYLDKLSSKQTKSAPDATGELDVFFATVRRSIDRSRKVREWSPYGMLGPGKQDVPVRASASWSSTHLKILHFMENWAASDLLPPTSQYHWIGAAILRATDRYSQSDRLDNTAGWTFLQEIGWLTPWEIHARHALRLPGLQLDRKGGLLPVSNKEVPMQLGKDRLAPIRKTVSASTVYCIDSEDTTDVDDGISIEPTDKKGEYWIHVHVADPASRIEPRSPTAKRAALMGQSSWLAGHYDRMFSDDIVQKTFSLAPNRPALTFSARVSEAGEILDRKIAPGILHDDVINITPESVSELTGEDMGAEKAGSLPTFEVGTPPTTTGPVRRMTPLQELSEQQTEELKLLSRIAAALRDNRVQKGAVEAFQPSLQTQVSLEGVQITENAASFLQCAGNPYIRIAYGNTGSPMVNSIMQLAGQVAAEWCYERAIPIPFRGQPLARKNLDLIEPFTKNVLYPMLRDGKKPTPDHYYNLRSLLGGFDISSTPYLNYLMGLDMYAKVTSPLRRYADLLAHWQIGATLMEEFKRGKSLAVRSADDARKGRARPPRLNSESAFLPFNGTQLEQNVFPILKLTELHAKLLENGLGKTEWVLQALVRAWKFGEGDRPLPNTFRFTVNYVAGGSRRVYGNIDWFDLNAVLPIEGLAAVTTTIADVKIGDEFRVQLDDVNVHSRTVTLKALNRL